MIDVRETDRFPGRYQRSQGQMRDLKPPLLSIITVVLNGAATLEKAIRSVVGRPFKDFEYIIVDGGSVDGSVEIIKQYKSKLTHWVSEPDQGVYDAMNKALSLASGKWVYFLGADDQLVDGFDRAITCLQDARTVYYGNVYRSTTDRLYDGKFSAYKLACRNICHQSIFYPQCVWDRYAYNLKYPVFADYDLNLRCFADADLIFQYVPETIAMYSGEGGISRTQRDSAFEADKLTIIRRLFPLQISLPIRVRSFLIDFLILIRLQRLAVGGYHYAVKGLQKVAQVFGRDKR